MAGLSRSATVIIPCLNDRDGLRSALEALSHHERRNELLVIAADNGSTDGSAEIGRALADVALAEPQRGSYRARNAALALVETPFVLTLDADCQPVTNDWAWKHVAALGASEAFASAGAILPLPSDDWWAMRAEITPQPQIVGDRPLFAVGANACYRTAQLRHLRGFPPYQADDVALGIRARRAGFQYTWAGDAAVYHRNPRGWRGYYRQMRKVGFYIGELDGRPPNLAAYWLGRTRQALSSLRPLARLKPREAAAILLRTAGQARGGLDAWRSSEQSP